MISVLRRLAALLGLIKECHCDLEVTSPSCGRLAAYIGQRLADRNSVEVFFGVERVVPDLYQAGHVKDAGISRSNQGEPVVWCGQLALGLIDGFVYLVNKGKCIDIALSDATSEAFISQVELGYSGLKSRGLSGFFGLFRCAFHVASARFRMWKSVAVLSGFRMFGSDPSHRRRLNVPQEASA